MKWGTDDRSICWSCSVRCGPDCFLISEAAQPGTSPESRGSTGRKLQMWSIAEATGWQEQEVMLGQGQEENKHTQQDRAKRHQRTPIWLSKGVRKLRVHHRMLKHQDSQGRFSLRGDWNKECSRLSHSVAHELAFLVTDYEAWCELFCINIFF